MLRLWGSHSSSSINSCSSAIFSSRSIATFSHPTHVTNHFPRSFCQSISRSSNISLSSTSSCFHKCSVAFIPRRFFSLNKTSAASSKYQHQQQQHSVFHRSRRRGFRFFSSNSQKDPLRNDNANLGLKAAMVVVFMLGGSYAAVPLYQMFCQHFGVGGTTQVDSKLDKLKEWRAKNAKSDREITVHFTANTNFQLPWEFFPTQKSVKVKVGETSLAFFTAKNKATTPIVGVATYNVVPVRAGLYFNKIQCFCFDEQRLLAGEEVDMPVFFFLDPKLLEDPKMNLIKEVTLSYTFFQSSDWDEDDGDETFVPAVEVQRQIEARKLKEEQRQSNAGG